MKIYNINGAPNGRKVEATALHLGVEAERVWLDIRQGEHKTEAFLAINPNGLVPVLVDDDFVLWESHAIMTYLAESSADSDLYPVEPRERAEVNRWLSWAQSELQPRLFPILRERFLNPVIRGIEGNENTVEGAMSACHEVLKILEDRLAKSSAFITGPDVTLADFALGATSGFWSLVRLPLEGYPQIKKWIGRLEEIPAWSRTQPPLERLQQA